MATFRYDTPSVVVLGNFNPKILQPAWLLKNELIRESEAAQQPEDSVQVIAPNFSGFSLGWANINVTLDRFQASAADATGLEPLRDLVVGVFTMLQETPVAALGLNRHMHVEVESTDKWHSLGHLLAPKEPWEGLVESPGMQGVKMQAKRENSPDGVLQITVEPSKKLRPRPGVYVATNEQYSIEAVEQLLEIVKLHCTDAWAFGHELAEKIVNLVNK